MISPHTPPGTKVVCIYPTDATLGATHLFFQPLEVGAVYTLGRIKPSQSDTPIDFVCSLDERPANHWFDLYVLSIAELPRSLAHALTSQPLIPEHEREVVSA